VTNSLDDDVTFTYDGSECGGMESLDIGGVDGWSCTIDENGEITFSAGSCIWTMTPQE